MDGCHEWTGGDMVSLLKLSGCRKQWKALTHQHISWLPYQPASGDPPRHFITNSKPSVQKLHSIHLQNTDILVSYDIVSLSTKVPLQENRQLLGQTFQWGSDRSVPVGSNINLFPLQWHIIWSDRWCHRGSLLAPVTANFYIQDSEHRPLRTLIQKPTNWYKYTVVHWWYCDLQTHC
jgi:hypothetical protein